ncbi:BRISC and BRCA1-A complex member 2-like isoform X2 [Neocloeon triangulifer]|nr:BRISC and BRCA1-A complex member 2-like isoform X2 [Neocloeon triangulifer]
MPVPCEAMMDSHTHFEKFFRSFSAGKFGTFDGNIQVSTLPHSRNFMEGLAFGSDRFLLQIPYAGDCLEWHVLFDNQEPESPPQFIFNRSSDDRYERLDSGFLEDFSVDQLEEILPSLANWDSDNEDALAEVIQELLIAFRRYQLEKLEEISGDLLSVQFKIRQLLEAQNISEDDLELLVRSDDVTLLVRLAVDISKVPELLLPPIERGRLEILASVLLTLGNNGQSSKLNLSPRMLLILGNSDRDLKVLFNSRTNLSNYVDAMRKALNEKVKMIVGGVNHRKNFLTALVVLMGRALVEHDTKKYTKSTFLLEWNNFYFLVHCCLPPSFPDRQPIYLFQSIYHNVKQRPFTSKCSDYPYDPNWSYTEMAEKAQSFILEYVKNFQKDSVRAS